MANEVALVRYSTDDEEEEGEILEEDNMAITYVRIIITILQ